MKKTLIIFSLFITLLSLNTRVSFGSPLNLKAENGAILAPAGLGVELNGILHNNAAAKQNLIPTFEVEFSYGISPLITISGAFAQSRAKDAPAGTIVKACYSPTRESNGYTLYADYDLGQAKVANYGITLWSDIRFLYLYANLNANKINQNKPNLSLTPGANIQIGSKLKAAGELAINPADWSWQELSAAVGYRLTQKIDGKFEIENSLTHSERVYKTGISMFF